MVSNFSFLKKDRKYQEIQTACQEAEKALLVSNSSCAIHARKALEIAVKWTFRYDEDLSIPYQDKLSTLVHDYTLKDILEPERFPRIKFMITRRNKAVHTPKAMRREEAVEALRNLYDFISWIDFSYSVEIHQASFNASVLPDSDSIEKKTRQMRVSLAAKEEEWKKKEKELKEQLAEATERAKATAQRKENEAAKDFVCDDMSEFKTRKIYIDLALEMLGWEFGSNCLEEVQVSGMPNQSGTGFVDYVLYADNGKPLAVIEAKRTSVDPKKGKQQAKLYADCLEAKYKVRPLIFYSNGFETWFWDDSEYSERIVSGFFTKDELDWYYYRKANKQSIASVDIQDHISNRPYQKKAIQSVCEAFEQGQRKALLVMATGSGKTRTAVSIVDVLQRYGWVKHILFLADRRELVKQAKKDFVFLLPNLSICNLLDSKDDPNSRMVFSTYPTLMNAIDGTRREDGSKMFSSGHFDLIIIDESHRSIFKKFKDIFTYFDGNLLGLTATPKGDIDKNTYRMFDVEDKNPTFAYDLAEAISENYLVPYSSIETKLKLVEEGIHYDNLSEEEKEQWEDTFDEGVSDISGKELNEKLFNSDTVNRVLQDLMERGIKVEGGDKIGKTIIFAANTKHADFILERYNALFKSSQANLADVIYNGKKYVDDVIDHLKLADKKPQIGISVDMLDTGIDIPELVNLVFFKRVRSQQKFWQMVGRGTRLCPDLFGVGQDKEKFLIFDYCGNMEHFRANQDGVEAKIVKSLTENLFNIRVKIAQALQHLDFQTDLYKAHRQTLVKELYQAVCMIDEDHFSSRMRIEFIHRYKQLNAWKNIADPMVKELEEQIAGLVTPIEDNELAKRFDFLMYAIQFAYLQGQPIGKPKLKVIQTAQRLAEKGNLAQVQKHAKLIEDLQTDEHWNNADLIIHETVREALRDLLVLLDKQNTEIYYTDFADEAMDVVESEGNYGVSDLLPYRQKVNAYLMTHQDDLVVYKLRNAKELTKSDVEHLQKLLFEEIGTEEEYHKTFGDEPLVKLVAGLVGLEREAANQLFSDFINDQTLNRQQMEFVTLIVNHVVENGSLDKTVLNEHPFNKYGSVSNLFEARIDTVKKVVGKIDELNRRINFG